jgi:hypothetical protein
MSFTCAQEGDVKERNKNESETYKFYQEKIKSLSKLIIESDINENILEKIDQEYQSTVLYGIVIDEEKLNELTLILFLKLHRQYLNDDMIGFNLGSYMKRNTSIAFFALHYCKMTNYFDELFTCFIYEWVITQPKYLENPYIEKEVKGIKEILAAKRYEYPKYLQLKDEMFYNK